MKYRLHLAEISSMEFNIVPITIFVAVFPVVIGLLLRLPKLIMEIKERKQWTFDWIKFVVVGLPSLYIVVMSIIPYTMGEGKIRIPEIILIGGPTMTTIAGIIFGYVLLDSLKK
jgi:hypothetical protein